MDDTIDALTRAAYGAFVRITSSARKHGVSVKDIRHAMRNLLRDAIDLDELKILYVGAACDGTPLEIIVVDDADRRVIHAMKARTKYWP